MMAGPDAEGVTETGTGPTLRRCADCHQVIAPDRSGHLSWCPFDGGYDYPSLTLHRPAGAKPALLHPEPEVGP